jgi:ribonuclease R
MEKLAAEAERASIKYKQVQFLQDKIGEEFQGIISGVTEWGIFVELKENHCEGMIRLRDLQDDNYYFDEDNYCLRGKKYGKVLTLGDEVTIQVKRADLVKKQLDFSLVEIADKKEGQSSSKKNTSFERKENFKDKMKAATQKNAAAKKSFPSTSENQSPKKSNPDSFYDEWGFEV